MLSVLFTALLSFSLVGSSFNAVAQFDYQPELNVSIGSFEVEWWREGFIGRHQMASYTSVEYLGPIEVKKLSKTYNAAVLGNFHFTESVKTVEESTVSLTISATSKFVSTLGVKAGLDNIEISSNYSLEQIYSIEGTRTYTIANELVYTVEYDVNPEAVSGRKFYLAEAAYVYKIESEKWQYDDYWWGNYEVDGSRSSFVTYVTLDPYVTIAFEDGTLL